MSTDMLRRLTNCRLLLLLLLLIRAMLTSPSTATSLTRLCGKQLLFCAHLLFILNALHYMYTLIHESVVAYFACRTSAKMPAASGALADVPVCISVQLLRRSVVT